MVSVYQVYQSLKDVANKEQKGFITPQVFNNFASLAQLNIYNEMFSELVDAKRISRQNLDPGRDKSIRKQKLEDLSFYIKRSELGVNDTTTIGPLGVTKPADMSRLISVVADVNIDSEVNEDIVQCQLIYDPEKISYLLSSNLSKPSLEFPVALISGSAIEVFPSEVDYIELTYYSKPGSITSGGNIVTTPPHYAFNSASFGNGESEFFNPSSSRDFHLPSHYLTEVVMEMAKLIGIRLRDPQVTAFATQEEASK